MSIAFLEGAEYAAVTRDSETFPISRGELESLRFRLKEANELLEPLVRENDSLKARIAELETSHKALAHDQIEIAKALNMASVEHSGYKNQAPRVRMLAERSRCHAEKRIEETKKRKAAEARITELEAQLSATLRTCGQAEPTSDGRAYAEGCAP